MNQKIGILTLHGMGRQKPDFDLGLQEELLKRLPPEPSSNILFETIHYHDQFQHAQEQVWKRMNRKRLDWSRLRRFMLYYFSDAATYEAKPDTDDSVYQKVNRDILARVDNLRDRLGGNRPVIVIAHSLGCQVISNYIWDAERRKGIWKDVVPTKFQKLATLRLMMTTGCNIPLFVSGLETVEAIAKPNDSFQWFNYYDRDDVLGWPLKPLSDSYEEVVAQDVQVNTSWSPEAHVRYWDDEDVLDAMAKRIHAMWKDLP